MKVHEHTSVQTADVAAWVGEEPVFVADVLRREAALRNGVHAALLPVRRSPQGRNVVRWIVQLIATERVVTLEAASRRLSPPEHAPQRILGVSAALELGGVLATVLSTVPVGEVVRDAVSAHVALAPGVARAYYDDNPEQFHLHESRLVEATGRDRASTYRVIRGELPAEWEREVFAADLNTAVAIARDRRFTIRDIQPGHTQAFGAVHLELSRTLRERARDRCFADWMHQRLRCLVTLETGYEHPGDPRHRDATHRH